ncbi:MAG: hypothetical protein CW335_03785, partial [Clostridiales bacterium]|nr:hypothetical protein [Clostridiales bacterium]
VKEHKDLPLSGYAADAALKEKIKPYAEAAEVNVNRSVGKLTGTWNSVPSYYLAQSDAMDLINRAQIARGSYYLTLKYRTAEEVSALKAKTGLDHLTVDFSATSMVVSGGYKVSAGEMSMKDIYKLYKYDNTLYLLPLTGQQIKDIMEFNASERLSVNTMSGTPSFGTKGDDFTNPIFYGLDFVYDMSKEVGSRVIISGFADGRAFDLNKTYIMAVNNYHLGNGPFADYSTEDTIWSQVDDSVGSVPDLIAEFISAETESKGGVSPAPSKWSIVYTGTISGGGTATGTYIGSLVVDPSTLSDGDQIMIYHIAGNQLVTSTAEGTKLAASSDVSSGDKQLGTNDASAIFRVKKGSDGYFRFLDASGNYMTYGETGNSLTMSETETQFAQWEFEAKNTPADGITHIHCVNAAYNGNYNQYLEFYSAFTTYGIQSGGGAYEYMIFRLTGSDPQPTEPTNPTNPTAPTEPTEKPISCTHSYQESKVASTCTTPGYTLHVCSKCGDSYRSDFTALGNHSYENGFCKVCGVADPNYKPVPTPSDDYPLYAGFKDLDKEAWYREGIVYCLHHGLMNGIGSSTGKSSETFDPNGNVSRAMLVTIVYRAAGSPATKGLKIPFEDVESGRWYTGAVAWAADKEIVKGVSEEEFAPDRFITREQLAAILYRFAGEPEAKGNLAGYIDAKEVSEYAIPAMKWAIGEGIITGMNDHLAPQEYATRAQIATMMFRFLDPVAAKEAQEIREKDPNPYD